MKDHDKAQLVNRLRDTALEFRDSEQLRERIAGILLPALESLERYMAHEAGAALAQVAQNLAGPALRTRTTELQDAQAPEDVPAILRRAAEKYREAPGDLSSVWGDPAAGAVWEVIARSLDVAADKIERQVERRGGGRQP